MNIRKLHETEIDKSMQMSEYAFQYSLSDEERVERRQFINPDEIWIAEEDGQILSKASILPLHVYMHGKKVPMGGVSGVATWPEHRRGGLVRDLLFQSLKEMKEKGQLLSFLAPFSIPFYRQFGWELFAEEQKITLTREQLPPRKAAAGYVKRVEKDYTLLDSVYQQWASRFNGTLVRDADWWKRAIVRPKKHHLAVYYNEKDEAKGYIFYEVKEEKMTIDELIWLDIDSRDGLLTFISNHDSMVKKVVLTTTPNDGLPFILPDPQVDRQIISYFMARIVDVKGFLEMFPFVRVEQESSPIVLHITDEFCQWNDGTYFIHPQETASQGAKIDFYPSVNVEASSCQHPPKRGIRLSVQTLTALLLNSQEVNVLMREGFIQGDEATANRFDNAIPKGQPFIYDFF